MGDRGDVGEIEDGGGRVTRMGFLDRRVGVEVGGGGGEEGEDSAAELRDGEGERHFEDWGSW